MDFDDTIESVGAFGPFQYRLTVLMCVIDFLAAWHTMSPVYIAYTPPHWCTTPDVAENSTCTDEHLRHLTSPPAIEDGKVKGYEECVRYDHDYHSLTSTPGCDVSFNTSAPRLECESWTYDRSNMRNTSITDFDLVCSKASLGSSVAGMFMIVACLAFLVCGLITDRFGRRFMLLASNTLVLLVCVATYFTTNFLMFSILRILLSFGIAAVGTAGLILLLEMVGRQHRVTVGVCMGFSWGIAPHALTAVSYAARDWRTVHLIIAAPTLVTCVAIYFFALESPRWLIVRGRKKEANDVFKKIAQLNGCQWDCNTDVFIQEEKHENVARIFTRPYLLYTSCVQYIIWFANGLLYYGIIFQSPNFGNNPFVSFSISSVIDFPSIIPLLFLFSWFGRVIPLSVGNVCGGVCLLLTLVTDGYWISMILVMLSKGFVTCCYTGIWIYTNEVYPTSVRSSSSSIAYIATRVGSALGAYLWYLAAIYVHLPVMVCGGSAILGGILNLSLAETKGASMTQTIEEGEQFTKGNIFQFWRGKPNHRNFGEKSGVQTKKCSTESLQKTTSI